MCTEIKQCRTCKHFAQGETKSFCANELQTDNDLKEYLYYNFSCGLHEEGMHQSRIEYMQRPDVIEFWKGISNRLD